jgi:hypothetical protein
VEQQHGRRIRLPGLAVKEFQSIDLDRTVPNHRCLHEPPAAFSAIRGDEFFVNVSVEHERTAIAMKTRLKDAVRTLESDVRE